MRERFRFRLLQKGVMLMNGQCTPTGTFFEMFITITGGGERLLTHGTGVGFIPVVCTDVSFEVTAQRERFAANLTRVRFCVCVRTHVSLQVHFLSVGFPTRNNTTHEGLLPRVNTDVCFKGTTL